MVYELHLNSIKKVVYIPLPDLFPSWPEHRVEEWGLWGRGQGGREDGVAEGQAPDHRGVALHD